MICTALKDRVGGAELENKQEKIGSHDCDEWHEIILQCGVNVKF